jgi:hypothetical protein
MKRKYSKDWCQGFCRTCGHACCDYCEDINELQLKIKELEEQLFLKKLDEKLKEENEKTKT